MAHDSFATNPQYLIHIKHIKGKEGNVEFVCHLTQQPWVLKEEDNLASPVRQPVESVETTEATELITKVAVEEKPIHYPIGITLIRAEHNREYRIHKKRDRYQLFLNQPELWNLVEPVKWHLYHSMPTGWMYAPYRGVTCILVSPPTVASVECIHS